MLRGLISTWLKVSLKGLQSRMNIRLLGLEVYEYSIRTTKIRFLWIRWNVRPFA